MTFEQIETGLTIVWAEVDGIPETAADWPTLPDEDQYDFILEWDNLMGVLRKLTNVYEHQESQMTRAQVARYERLIRRFQDVLPTIQWLGLQTVATPKLAARTS